MNYSSIIGYTHEDRFALCVDCARRDMGDIRDETREDIFPVFAGEEGGLELICDSCLETLEECL